MSAVAEISPEVVERAVEEVAGLSPARGRREVERILQDQEALFSLVMDVTAELSDEAHSMALYLGVVVYRAYEMAFSDLPAATEDEIAAVFEANQAWLQETETSDEDATPEWELPQPAVMQYVGDCLFAEEEEPELDEEDQGLTFLALKAFVEVLDRCAARRETSPPAKAAGRRRRAPRTPAVPVYELKITLKGIRPPIWRRFRVRSDISLGRLHVVLQTVMGWTDSHLHQFRAGGRVYGVPDPGGSGFGPKVLDERRARLSALLPEEKDRFTYDYDFGDGWEHTVVVEKILPPDREVPAPWCVRGRRACPPEDCGGPWGYEEMLEAVADPGHPRRDEIVEWLGGEWDPEEFDPETVNALLMEL